ncbi:Uncharacterised protein (plasmid) [Mesomycoplasma conjunctivae]|nr:Uncharacterised protein [Mycoplasmopsis fermentans]VEU66981.1 Uncharacterised protein [Mesomycoplasma conjunctivae]
MGQAIFDMFLNNAKDYENIESLCKIIWGQCPKGNNILSENVSNNLMLYASGAGDLENNKILISPKAFTDKPIKIIDNRTICMSIAGTVGKIGISDKNIAIGRAMVGFYNEKKFGLIYFILNKYSSFLKRQSIGAIQKIINKNHLNIVNVPILTNEKNNLLNELITKCMKLEKNTLSLIKLKEKLIPLLINGQIEIN